MNIPEAYQNVAGNLAIKSFTEERTSPKIENAKDVTKRSLIKLMGSKLEKGEIARLVMGPTTKRIVPIRFEIEALDMRKAYLKHGQECRKMQSKSNRHSTKNTCLAYF